MSKFEDKLKNLIDEVNRLVEKFNKKNKDNKVVEKAKLKYATNDDYMGRIEELLDRNPQTRLFKEIQKYVSDSFSINEKKGAPETYEIRDAFDNVIAVAWFDKEGNPSHVPVYQSKRVN